MKMKNTLAALDIDAYIALANYNPDLAVGLAADISDGATLDDVQLLLDASPQLSRQEADLILRAAVHLITRRDHPQPIRYEVHP